MSNLRQKLIRLAYTQPSLRKDLLPLMKRAGQEQEVIESLADYLEQSVIVNLYDTDFEYLWIEFLFNRELRDIRGILDPFVDEHEALDRYQTKDSARAWKSVLALLEREVKKKYYSTWDFSLQDLPYAQGPGRPLSFKQLKVMGLDKVHLDMLKAIEDDLRDISVPDMVSDLRKNPRILTHYMESSTSVSDWWEGNRKAKEMGYTAEDIQRLRPRIFAEVIKRHVET
jgi:hypothetical protein